MTPNSNPQALQPVHGVILQAHSGQVTGAPPKPGKLLRLASVEDMTGFRKSSIYAGVRNKTFPAPVRLSARAVGWREHDIQQWIASRVSVGQA
jgi:prophage regulatory protein